ncbi:hypothetical protein [Macrococcus animalis]|uniref:hypothetical protein n=1 Tax=Macrococcus animalis TaxID=3395467 RepID=UPI0039BE5CF7
MNKGLINIHIITTNNINGATFLKNNEINMLKVATYIKLARQSGHVILLNNGPFLTGSPVSVYYAGLKEYKRIPLITLMNLLKYDATNISHQDFDLSFKFFSRAHSMSEFPFLSCNILNLSTKEPYFNTPYIIKQYKGVKIGIIALSEAKQIDNEELIVSKPKDSIKSWIRYMYDKDSPDFVIALHNGDINDLCTTEGDITTLCTEGIHLMITNSNDTDNVKHDLTDIIFAPRDSLLHIKLVFKERTNSFELKGSSYEFIETARYQEDILLNEALYYEEKEYLHFQQQ